MVGVQSNQFPRAVDLARPFLAAGLPVCIGGFHVSGCIAMLPEMPKEIRAAQELGISFFAGEAEDGRLDEVLRDAWNGTLAPLYNHMNDLPALQGAPRADAAAPVVRRTSGTHLEHRPRPRLPVPVLVLHHHQRAGPQEPRALGRRSRAGVRENYARGHQALLHHRRQSRPQQRCGKQLFDRMIKMKVDEGMDIGFTIQVDTLCHKIPNFIEKATKGGARRIFIGMENINPDNLMAPRSARTRSPTTAPCCRNGATTAR